MRVVGALAGPGSPPSSPLLNPAGSDTRVAGLVLVDVRSRPRARRVAASRRRGMLDAHTRSSTTSSPQMPRWAVTAALDCPSYSSAAASGSPLTGDDVEGLCAWRAPTVTSIPVPDTSLPGTNRWRWPRPCRRHQPRWPAVLCCRSRRRSGRPTPGGNLLDPRPRWARAGVSWGGSRRRAPRRALPRHLPDRRLPTRAAATRSASPTCGPAIGDDAEALVYRYDACDREPTYAPPLARRRSPADPVQPASRRP